jgi:tRNA-uridine 2-sulfurtransferase
VVNRKKAVALYSGGLDSILAIKVILQQDIDVIGVKFETPFIENKSDAYIEKSLNIVFVREDISEDFKKILLNPKHGYGKNINPCIDCRVLMFRKAGEIMEREKASFIISGEVLGQRPMSQNKKSLLMISEESGYSEWIVRPLSALMLPETKPEKLNIINRLQLLDIQGRSRKRQIELAKNWGINKYLAPAGGCKLTEPGFARRMNDLLLKNKFDKNDIDLLKVGRHFVLHEYAKLVIGRNEKENEKIFSLVKAKDYLLNSQNFKGPLSLLRIYTDSDSHFSEMEKILDLASKITARYCDKDLVTDLIDINIWNSAKNIKQKKYVRSLPEQEIDYYLI